MTTRHITTVETAKLIRTTLRASFPGVRFSVRSDSYAGGSSIRVRWTDGPTEDQVESLIGHYKGSTFDGMTDMKSYHDTLVMTENGPELVWYGADHVFVDRDLSPSYLEFLRAKVRDAGGDPDSQVWHYVRFPEGDQPHRELPGYAWVRVAADIYAPQEA